MGRTEQEPGSEGRQREALAHAAAYAAQGDLKGMVGALASSRFLDGLSRQLADQYDALPKDEVQTCIADTVDQFFTVASGGRRIANPGGWLWKTAWNKARDLWLAEYKGREPLDVEGAHTAADEDPAEREAAEGRLERLREDALRHARALAPQVGQGQVVQVLELLLDAVAQGLPDLPAEVVAETLGIGEAAARSLMSRALRRLERAARSAGIQLPDGLVPIAPASGDGDAPDPDL